MSMSVAQLIAAGERAQKRPSTPKKKAKKKSSKKRAKRASSSRKTVIMSEAQLAKLRRAMQTEVLGRPVRKKRAKAKPKPKPKPKPKKAKKKAAKKKAKKKASKRSPKPGSPAWVKKMQLARKKAARKR